MELIKDIPFCSNADRQFKLDLCLPNSVDDNAIRKHIKFKSATKVARTEKNVNILKTRDNQQTVTKRYSDSPCDSIAEFGQEQADKDTVKTNTDNELEETRPSAKNGKVPFVIFVHGGGWRRGGKQAWKHYLYHDVNFFVAILQWLLNVHRNVGISLAQSGIGCALISYPLTEQDVPYVFIEMLLSYIQSCFVTFLGLFPIGLFIYLLQMHGTNRISWMHVISGTRYDIRSSCVLIVLLTTNIFTLIIFTVKREKFKLSSQHTSLLWVMVLSTFIWINLLTCTKNYQLIFFTLLTFVISQLVILRRRLSRREITFADQAKVVARAVHWVKRLARKSGQFDREKIYLMGHSAGGHLITLTVLDDFYLKDACCSVQDIKGVISLAGVYDLDCLNSRLLKQTYLVPNFGEHEPTWRKASPFHQVKKSKTVRRPKFLLMSAELDPLLVRQSHAFSEKLTESGLDCQHVTVHGSNHFTIITNLVRIFGENDLSVLKLTVEFISQS